MSVFRLTDLFDGRHDCYFDSGRTGLVWAEDEINRRVDPLDTEDDFFGRTAVGHFTQKRDIGVYPRRDDGTCKWGCVDIDTGDFSEALRVQEGLRTAGIDSWVEASGSWKDLSKRGYHVWVFSDEWVDAIPMRAMLVEVVRHAEMDPKTEINPKQIAATAKGVGNCVRLPYGKRSTEHPGYSCMVLSPGGEFKDFTVEEFLDEVTPTPAQMIVEVGNSALTRQTMRKSVEQALDRLRRHESHSPPYAPGGGGQSQRAWKILRGLDRASEGERNLCAFVISCHLKGLGRSLEQAHAEMANAVQRSFEGGESFLDEALRTLDRVYAS